MRFGDPSLPPAVPNLLPPPVLRRHAVFICWMERFWSEYLMSQGKEKRRQRLIQCHCASPDLKGLTHANTIGSLKQARELTRLPLALPAVPIREPMSTERMYQPPASEPTTISISICLLCHVLVPRETGLATVDMRGTCAGCGNKLCSAGI